MRVPGPGRVLGMTILTGAFQDRANRNGHVGPCEQRFLRNCSKLSRLHTLQWVSKMYRYGRTDKATSDQGRRCRSPIEEWQPTRYAVDGLPEGQAATLTEINEGWIITREIGGIEEKSVR